MAYKKIKTTKKDGEFIETPLNPFINIKDSDKKEFLLPQLTPYQEKLKDKRWQKKRIAILNRDGCECRYCGEADRLNVHHINYIGEPWDCPDNLLITLCNKCHEEEEAKLKTAKDSVFKHFRNAGLMANEMVQLAQGLKDSCISLTNNDYAISIILYAISNKDLMSIANDLYEFSLKNRKAPF